MAIVTNYAQLQAACEAGGLVQVANNITLTNYVRIPPTSTVQLESINGAFTLYAPSSRHFIVRGAGTQGSGGSLTLSNIILDGNNTSGGISMGAAGDPAYLSGGTLILNDGAIVQNCRATFFKALAAQSA